MKYCAVYREHFVKELEEMGDKSYTTYNKV